MCKFKITPVILAGGTGTRLWPLSREDTPKQFCKIDSAESLFQKSVQRVSDTKMFNAPIIVTGERYGAMVQTQMDELSVEPNAIICEPVGKDTAAAVLLAVELSKNNKNELMMVMPSDHMMGDEAAFLRAVEEASSCAAQDGLIVTFGIKPSYPETGFGYLRAGSPFFNKSVCNLDSFIEKPNVEEAELLLLDKDVFWNAGIFLFDRSVVIGEFEQHATKLTSQVRKAIVGGQWTGISFDPEPKEFEKITPISFDYSIMENTSRAAINPVDPKWSDLGSWKAVWDVSERDHNENAVGEGCFTHDTRTSLVRSDGPAVAVCGLKDVVVVASKDAVLVTSRENPQGVKHLVCQMKTAEVEAAIVHSGEDRPWGRIDTLGRGEEHKVKHIRVDPGARLSLQYHHNRSEHWVVVRGMATVTVGEEVVDLSVGQQVSIPQGAIHRLDNFTSEPVEIVEVQIGSYLSEDDIVRVEEGIYGRTPTPTTATKKAA